MAIFDLSSCIYKFTEPLISSYDDLYFADEELDYFSDNDELYGDYEVEEEGQKASEKAYIAHEVHRAFISRSNPYSNQGHNKLGIANSIARYDWQKAENERKEFHNHRIAKEMNEIISLQQAEELKRTRQLEDLEWRRCIMHIKAVNDARKITVLLCMLPMQSPYNLRQRKPHPQPGKIKVDTFLM